MTNVSKIALWIAGGFAAAAILQFARGPLPASDHLPHLTDDTFGSFIGRATLPVLVDFYADWCGPCRRVAPLLTRLENNNRGRLTLAKLNTDHAQRTASRFGVSSIPCLILFHHSNEVDRITGALSLDEYQAWLDRHLPPAAPPTP